MHFRLQAHAGHADRLADAFLVIDQELLRQDVQDLLIGRNGDGARRIDDAIDVARTDLFVANGDDAVRVQAAHMAARDTGIDGVNIAASHEFGLLDGALYRVHGGLDIDDHAFLQAARRVRTDADNLDDAVLVDLPDDSDDFGRADVETYDQVFLRAFRH